jgi:hypothetical protein
MVALPEVVEVEEVTVQIQVVEVEEVMVVLEKLEYILGKIIILWG